MSETLGKLRDNLHQQTKLYFELNQLAGMKQEALVHNNLHDLESVTLREEQLLLEAARLEKERMLWAEQIGQEMGKAPEELTLSELADRYPELQEVHRELNEVVSSLREAHDINTQLINQALKVVDFTMNLITQRAETTYGPPNRKDQKAPSKVHMVDRSV